MVDISCLCTCVSYIRGNVLFLRWNGLNQHRAVYVVYVVSNVSHKPGNPNMGK